LRIFDLRGDLTEAKKKRKLTVMQAARAQIESLLKARKLDVAMMTPSAPLAPHSPDDLAAVGVPSIDAALGGGLRRGQVSEIVGARSSGRTTVVCRALAAAAARGELVALVDTCDRFDPESAADAGLDLSRLLWIRETGDPGRALKAMNLVLQAGGFGLDVLDLEDVSPRMVRSLPFTTWFRLARVIEGSQTVALLIAGEHLARSAGGATIALEKTGEDAREKTVHAPATCARWVGRSDHARLLHRLDMAPRVVGGRR
jgi:hypothetical protein